MKKASLRTALILCGTLCFLGLADRSSAWERISGDATAISISPEGDVYVLGTQSTDGGKVIYRYSANGWLEMPGGGVAIAAGPEGELWITDNQANIFRFGDHGWQQIDGKATDIAVGNDGSVYSIGTNECGSGFGIYRFADPNGWEQLPGCATKIDISPEGIPWVVNRRGKIFKLEDGDWQQMPGSAVDIAVGRRDQAWVVGTTPCHGGRRLFHFSGDGWLEMDGCAVALDVSSSAIWVVNSRGEIYRQYR